MLIPEQFSPEDISKLQNCKEKGDHLIKLMGIQRFSKLLSRSFVGIKSNNVDEIHPAEFVKLAEDGINLIWQETYN